jgi:hypothetical protein
MYRCISAYSFITVYPCCYLALSFYSCTCWVPTISVLNLAIFPLLLKPAAQKEKMDRNSSTRSSSLRVTQVAIPMVLWSLPLFILLRVILVVKDIIYVIIILYIYDIWLSVSTFGRMCGTIDPGSCKRWVLSFGIKPGYDSHSIDKVVPSYYTKNGRFTGAISKMWCVCVDFHW